MHLNFHIMQRDGTERGSLGKRCQLYMRVGGKGSESPASKQPPTCFPAQLCPRHTASTGQTRPRPHSTKGSWVSSSRIDTQYRTGVYSTLARPRHRAGARQSLTCSSGCSRTACLVCSSSPSRRPRQSRSTWCHYTRHNTALCHQQRSRRNVRTFQNIRRHLCITMRRPCPSSCLLQML